MQRSSEPARVRPASQVSARYSALRREHTGPELALRRELHRRGLRYRVQQRIEGLPRRKVDIVFSRARLIVLVDGCFWHGCEQHRSTPRTNTDWWAWKIQRTQERDADTNRRLAKLGWSVLRVWEHELPVGAADRVQEQLCALLGVRP